MTRSFRLPPEYQQIKRHLQSSGTWHKTTIKFNVFEICSAINQYIKFYGDTGDLRSAIEELRDYPSVASWLEAQSVKEGYIPEENSQTATDELKKRAKMLGFKLLSRTEVAVNRNEYVFLKGLETSFKKRLKYT